MQKGKCILAPHFVNDNNAVHDYINMKSITWLGLIGTELSIVSPQKNAGKPQKFLNYKQARGYFSNTKF